jgi:hypothetical protein
MNVVYNAKARTLTVNEKTFGPEDVAMYNRMWISEDGPMPGYVAPFNGTIEKITPKRVFFWGTKSITHERFAELNG